MAGLPLYRGVAGNGISAADIRSSRGQHETGRRTQLMLACQMESRHDVTRLLHAARDGSQDAFDALMPLVYDELRAIAHQRLVRHRPGETLNTTALVHEVYLKVVNQAQADWHDRSHFFALASRAMRFILIDYVRSRMTEKRGSGREELPLDAVQVAADERAADLLALDEALETLAAADERLSRLVEFRFFGGLTYEEIAEVTGLSLPTVKRDWRRARAWLFQVMKSQR